MSLLDQTGLLQSGFLFQEAPFASCHASTIVQSQGQLIAAFFGGSDEGKADVSIWVSRQEKEQWTAPVEVADGIQSPTVRFPCWNPVLFQPEQGPLLLFYKVGPSPQTWWGMLTRSFDGGKTWSPGQRLPHPFVGPIKNKPLQLANGDILYPSSSEVPDWRIHFERTDANVQGWQATQALNDGQQIRAIQPSLLLFGDGRLQAVGRTKEGRLFSIGSLDAGHTWSEMSLLHLPNPDSGTDALTLRDGRHLVIYNHSSTDRSPLCVALSHDGQAWTTVLTLEDAPGEFSYPAAIQTQDGLVSCTYTWNRKRIRYVVIDPMQLPTPSRAFKTELLDAGK